MNSNRNDADSGASHSDAGLGTGSYRDANCKEMLAEWMLMRGMATGHADTLEELLAELGTEIDELREYRAMYEGLCK